MILSARTGVGSRVGRRAESVVAVLSDHYGDRMAYRSGGPWRTMRARRIAPLSPNPRGEVYVNFRIVGRVGKFRGCDGSWSRLTLQLPEDEPSTALAELFRRIVRELEPEVATLGADEKDTVGIWTFLSEANSPQLTVPGVAVEVLGAGILYFAESSVARDALRTRLGEARRAMAPGSDERRPERPASVAQAIAVPSYLKQLGEVPAPRPAPLAIEPHNPDDTVLGGAPGVKPLPFEGSNPNPPPPTPIEVAPDAGATVAVRLPVIKPTTTEFDPDVTQPPRPNPLPVIPFSGATSPERLREIAGPPVPEPSDQAGETVALPSSEEMRSIVRADLPLPEYAALRAALSVHGDDNAEVLAQFGLTPLQKQAIQLKYFNRFRDEPALRERFEALLRDAMRKINRGPGGAR